MNSCGCPPSEFFTWFWATGPTICVRFNCDSDGITSRRPIRLQAPHSETRQVRMSKEEDLATNQQERRSRWLPGPAPGGQWHRHRCPFWLVCPKIEGPGLDGGDSVYQGHPFVQRATYEHRSFLVVLGAQNIDDPWLIWMLHNKPGKSIYFQPKGHRGRG